MTAEEYGQIKKELEYDGLGYSIQHGVDPEKYRDVDGSIANLIIQAKGAMDALENYYNNKIIELGGDLDDYEV